MSFEQKIKSANFNVNALAELCHKESRRAGWYTNKDGSEKTRNIPEMLCLIHSEISEAMEGIRKNLRDDKLSHRPAVEADLDGAIAEKLIYNRSRADHKLENRIKEGGKAF